MVSLAVLAGGKSSRMGQDKGSMIFLGRPLILHVIEQLAPLSDDVFIISNRPEQYTFTGLTVYPDIQPGVGPLGGIYTAMSRASQPLLAMVGCDMPFACLSLFEEEVNRIRRLNADVIIPSTPQGLEPLHAIYRVSTCLPLIRESINRKNFKIIGWFDQATVSIMDPMETRLQTPDYRAFININTPDEFSRAEQLYHKS